MTVTYNFYVPGVGLVVGLRVVNGGTVATPEGHNNKHK